MDHHPYIPSIHHRLSCSASTEAYFDTYNAAADAARVLHSTLVASVASWSFQFVSRSLDARDHWDCGLWGVSNFGREASAPPSWQKNGDPNRGTRRTLKNPWDDFAVRRRNPLPLTNLCNLIWVSFWVLPICGPSLGSNLHALGEPRSLGLPATTRTRRPEPYIANPGIYRSREINMIY